MADTAPCVPCCSTPQTTNIPGPQGSSGTDGANGANAYTATTADFAVPNSPGGTVTIQVANALWMVEGQMVVVAGPATFRVQSVGSATSATLVWQAATGDLSGGTTISSGAGVSPAGVGVITAQTVYAAGTAYQLTATPAKVDFGTTDPVLTIAAAGTYLLFTQFVIDYNGATFAASRTVTMKLRRTNNTAADITNATAVMKTSNPTTSTFTMDNGTIPPIVYTTTNSDDVIELWGSVSIVPTAGSLDVSQAALIALKIV